MNGLPQINFWKKFFWELGENRMPQYVKLTNQIQKSKDLY